MLIGVAIFLGAWVDGAVTGSAAVPVLAISAGYLGFARLEKSWPVGCRRRGTGRGRRGSGQRLDDVVHERVRLGILAVLAEADEADFGYLLKEALGLTDGNLLEEPGYVRIDKTFDGRRPRT